jgi:hypothetical protein
MHDATRLAISANLRGKSVLLLGLFGRCPSNTLRKLVAGARDVMTDRQYTIYRAGILAARTMLAAEHKIGCKSTKLAVLLYNFDTRVLKTVHMSDQAWPCRPESNILVP